MSHDDGGPGGGRADKPSKQETFKVQIDKQVFEVHEPRPTARRLLEIAGKLPPDNFALYKKGKGGQPERLPLNEPVDLTDPGIERFVTLPLDQTEGLGGRRDFDLPEEDIGWLASLGLHYELVSEAGVLRVVIYDWPAPPGYDRARVDAHVRIDRGYPDTQIDMVYFWPPLNRADRQPIAATIPDSFDGKQWQRWSRHRTPANPWRPGLDNLATHFALVDAWLIRELAKG